MVTQIVTLELPEEIYRTAYQVAEATHQPLAVVLQNSIAQALPPLDDLPPEEATELAKLVLLDDAALWREASATLPITEQSELQELLDRQGVGELSTADESCLQALLDRYGQLMVRKAHAWLLLARRGYHVPVQPNEE